jgi:uncharacterized protein (TIRG00374 family)
MSVPIGRLGRILVAVGLTLFVLWKANPAQVWHASRAADLRWIAAAIGLVLFDRALMAYRWLVLLRAVEPRARPPIGPIMRIFFVSTFVGTFLPSVGGDLVRAYSLSRYGVDAGQSAASVLMDRMLGVASIFILGVIGVSLAGTRFADRGVVVTLAVALVACAATAVIIFSARAAELTRQLVSRLPGERAQRLGASLVDATRRYAHHHGNLINVLAGSVGVQVLRVVQAYCLGRALGIAAPPVVYFAFVPLILLIMLLPVTVNGLGTSQVAFVWFFSQAGVAEPVSFALSVLFVALGVIGNLPGGVLYATGGAAPRAERT